MRILAYATSGAALFSAGLTTGYLICRQNVRNLLLLVTHTREDRDRLKCQLRRLQRRSEQRHLRIVGHPESDAL